MWKDHAYSNGAVIPDPGPGEAYRVQELIGRGSYAEVYRAERVSTGALVALKVLQLHRTARSKDRERHRREGQLLLRLRHPNVVAVHAVVETPDGRIVMVMDLLIGRTLARLRSDCGGTLPINTAIEVAIQVCSALEAVHSLEVVHRDLKPDNIFVGEDGVIRLCDLGVSQFPHADRITTEDTTIGTVEYMSPEQLYSPQMIGPRSDLFALGVVLYELIAGVSPFAVDGRLSPNVKELGFQIILRPHVPLAVAVPDMPEYLAAIVESLLAKEPQNRYESAAVVRDLLDAAHARYLLELSEKRIVPPRISFVGRLPPVGPLDTDQLSLVGSANPFVTISFPPPPTELTAKPGDRPAALPDLPPPVHLAPKAMLPAGSSEKVVAEPLAEPGARPRVAGVPSTVRMTVLGVGPGPIASPRAPVDEPSPAPRGVVPAPRPPNGTAPLSIGRIVTPTSPEVAHVATPGTSPALSPRTTLPMPPPQVPSPAASVRHAATSWPAPDAAKLKSASSLKAAAASDEGVSAEALNASDDASGRWGAGVAERRTTASDTSTVVTLANAPTRNAPELERSRLAPKGRLRSAAIVLAIAFPVVACGAGVLWRAGWLAPRAPTRPAASTAAVDPTAAPLPRADPSSSPIASADVGPVVAATSSEAAPAPSSAARPTSAGSASAVSAKRAPQTPAPVKVQVPPLQPAQPPGSTPTAAPLSTPPGSPSAPARAPHRAFGTDE